MISTVCGKMLIGTFRIYDMMFLAISILSSVTGITEAID